MNPLNNFYRKIAYGAIFTTALLTGCNTQTNPSSEMQKSTVSKKAEKTSRLEESVNIKGLSMKNPNNVKISLYFDGKEHPEHNGFYISANNEIIIFGQNDYKAGPLIRFEKGNQFLEDMANQMLMVQAGKDDDEVSKKGKGLVKITKKQSRNYSHLDAFGSYRVYQGEDIYMKRTTPKGTELITWRIPELRGKKPYLMKMTFYDRPRYPLVKDKQGGYCFEPRKSKLELASLLPRQTKTQQVLKQNLVREERVEINMNPNPKKELKPEQMEVLPTPEPETLPNSKPEVIPTPEPMSSSEPELIPTPKGEPIR
jgi:hypothetical protein